MNILEAKRFDKESNDYDKSEIKRWLENDFKNEAFTTDQVHNIDKISLLSKEEVEKYFKTNEERMCKGTKYAIDNGLYVNIERYSYWWTSSNYKDSDHEHAVDDNGFIDSYYFVYRTNYGVRPACLINI